MGFPTGLTGSDSYLARTNRDFGKYGGSSKTARSRKKLPYGVSGREFGPLLPLRARNLIILYHNRNQLSSTLL